jgi:hypothetical protein
MINEKTFFNYVAFFILYSISLYYTTNNYTEIIGFGLLFIINTSFLLFVAKTFIPLFNEANLLFYFISLLFIIIAILHLHKKFSNIKGTPFVIPKSEKIKLNNFKYFMSLSIVIGTILLTLLYSNYHTMNMLKISDLFTISYDTILPLISTIFSISLLYMSYIQLTPMYKVMKLPKRQI